MRPVAIVFQVLGLIAATVAQDEAYAGLRQHDAGREQRRRTESGSNDEQGFEQRIINGVNAPLDRYPYSVSIQENDSHFCGGSLIAPDIVLSAAHCGPLNRRRTSVRVNPHRLASPMSESFTVVDQVRHPEYKTLGSYDHDFMIVKLGGQSRQSTVRLNEDGTQPRRGSSLQVMGWGTTSLGSYANVLQEVSVVAMSNDECRAAGAKYADQIFGDSLCVAEINQGACQGDSGGPLVIPGSDASGDVLVGLVAWGVGKCSSLLILPILLIETAAKPFLLR